MFLYVDSSALVRAYLVDEPEHRELRSLILEGSHEVFTSELARIELSSAIRSAGVAGRHRNWRRLVTVFEQDCSKDGVIALVALVGRQVLPRARALVLEHPLRTLDAIHLAVALDIAESSPEETIFVTRDRSQAAAARKLGLTAR
jgi:uncharacterized protein